MKRRPRLRLRMGFDDDFELIEVQVVRIEPVETDGGEQEQLEWLYTEVPVKRFRIKSSVLLALIAILLTGASLIA